MTNIDIYIMKLFSAQKGFTLIELLVVIGILGILAAALVATIDPFEQLKKADDAKIKNISVEFQTALVRYYTTHGSFPWNDANSANNAPCTNLGANPIAGVTLGSAGMIDCIDGSDGSLLSDGEVKSAFTSNVNDLDKIYITWSDADATNALVCFSPTSKSQKASPETKYTDVAGTEDANTCPDANAADGTCYWCTQ